jgi:hypothetical protein
MKVCELPSCDEPAKKRFCSRGCANRSRARAELQTKPCQGKGCTELIVNHRMEGAERWARRKHCSHACRVANSPYVQVARGSRSQRERQLARPPVGVRPVVWRPASWEQSPVA